MRLSISSSKNSKSYYVIKSIFEDGKRTTKIVEKLGTEKELMQKHGFATPFECETWAKEYVKELTKKHKEMNADINIFFNPSKIMQKDERLLYNGGYLFLQKIYQELGIPKLCKDITAKYKFEYDLNSILSRLVYGRIIFPSSKLSTYKLSKSFIQQPNFELFQIYRALEVIAKENDEIQATLYKNSLKFSERNTRILYYDLTNYYFEIEQPDIQEELRQYGVSKENRPNPIVQMGLFIDGNGIPLAFNIEKGNTNEQITLKPLEEKIIKDFGLSKFVVSTDAGLASEANRKFNSLGERAFVTTQSIKKMRKLLKDWALDPKGFKLNQNDTKIYDMSKIDDLEDDGTLYDKIFYKQRWFNEDSFPQRYVVTFSLKYRDYQRKIRQNQIDRALRLVSKNPSKIGKRNNNDYKRFIQKKSITDDGEVANKDIFSINTDIIRKEEMFDGFYCVATNLEGNPQDIIKINSRRWEIEESFRIMKSEFKARPVHLSNSERIKAHFSTCFIALLLYRILEKKLDEKFTVCSITQTLKNFQFLKIKGEGYIPAFTKTDITDSLHENFGFRLDYEFISKANMKKILTNFC